LTAELWRVGGSGHPKTLKKKKSPPQDENPAWIITLPTLPIGAPSKKRVYQVGSLRKHPTQGYSPKRSQRVQTTDIKRGRLSKAQGAEPVDRGVGRTTEPRGAKMSYDNPVVNSKGREKGVDRKFAWGWCQWETGEVFLAQSAAQRWARAHVRKPPESGALREKGRQT